MRDEELARIILTELRSSPSRTNVRDMIQIARDRGVEEHYQAQRVGRRLLEQGFVDDLGSAGDSFLATITEKGIRALETREYETLSERARSALEGEGQTAEAKMKSHE